jgi:uncharacterized protein
MDAGQHTRLNLPRQRNGSTRRPPRKQWSGVQCRDSLTASRAIGSWVEERIVDVTISMHQSSVGVFTQFLGSLSDLLDHAAEYAKARKIDPSILLNARLYPDMYSLTRQVGEANRHAVLACALMSGVEPLVFPDTEPDIAQLKARIAAAIGFIQALPVIAINAAAEKEVTFTFRNGSQRKFTGRSLLLTFSVPQFFFHVTTAYDILRHCGVDLVKKDFLGTPDPAPQA